MELWFRWCSFSIGWLCRFQPFIFRGVTVDVQVLLPLAVDSSLNFLWLKTQFRKASHISWACGEGLKTCWIFLDRNKIYIWLYTMYINRYARDGKSTRFRLVTCFCPIVASLGFGRDVGVSIFLIWRCCLALYIYKHVYTYISTCVYNCIYIYTLCITMHVFLGTRMEMCMQLTSLAKLLQSCACLFFLAGSGMCMARRFFRLKFYSPNIFVRTFSSDGELRIFWFRYTYSWVFIFDHGGDRKNWMYSSLLFVGWLFIEGEDYLGKEIFRRICKNDIHFWLCCFLWGTLQKNQR